jgi:hypothetical protein
VEGIAGDSATNLHDALSLPSDENSTMRCRKNLHDALSVRNKSTWNASPAADRGQLLLRSDEYLYCLGAN